MTHRVSSRYISVLKLNFVSVSIVFKMQYFFYFYTLLVFVFVNLLSILVFNFYSSFSFLVIIKPPLATARAAECIGAVHLFVCLFVCLSIKCKKKRFSISRMEFLHPAMWHVALES